MNIVIIGGVAGGMSFAARARRLAEHANIVVFEKDDHVSFANCGLPYYVGGEIEHRDALLLQTPESLRAALNIDVRTQHEVLRIARDEKTVEVLDRASGKTFVQLYDTLVISTGAAPIVPPMKGVDLPGVFTLRNVADVDALKTATDELDPAPSRAVVVGAGFIGLEVAEAFRHRGFSVDVVELANQVLPPLDPEMAAYVTSELHSQGVGMHLGKGVTGIEQSANDDERSGSSSLRVVLDEKTELAADIVLLAIGVRPNSKLAQDAGLQCNERGAIIVNPFQQTTDPSILAFGDATEVIDGVFNEPTVVPLAGPASRNARNAANALLASAQITRRASAPVLGTAIVRVFDLTVATTGKNAKMLAAKGVAFHEVCLHPGDHAGYFPGATQLHLKVLFAQDGKLLGAQAVGKNGVDKRIDVFATALRAGMHITDLVDLELCYAPPFGSAKDPINMAGFIGENLLSGILELWKPSDLAALQSHGSDYQLLDVRTATEYEHFHLEGALHIPHTELRERIAEVSQNTRVLVYCASGFRSYLAARILMQSGYSQVSSLNGGLLSFYADKL